MAKQFTGIGGPSNYNGFMNEEPQAKLAGSAKYTEFDKMANDDAICGGILLAINKIIQTIEWKVDDDPKGIVRESLDNVLWEEKLSDITSFLPFGFSAFETTIKESRKGRYVWNAMESRPQTTIERWVMDKGNRATGFKQRDSLGNTATVSLHNCLHFRTTAYKNNPEGKSILRNAYRDWYYKTNIERLESIGIERDLTGLPIITPPEDQELIDDKGAINRAGTWALETVQGIKRNEQEGVVLPFGWELNLLASPGDRQFNLNDVINRYDSRISISILAQFLIMGLNGSSAMGLNKEQSELFYKAVEGFALVIARTVNTQFIGMPALRALNNLRKMPQLVPIGSNRPDLQEVAAFLARLFKFNAITPDERLEVELRRMAGLPEMDTSSTRVALVESESKKNEDNESTSKQVNSGLNTNEDS